MNIYFDKENFYNFLDNYITVDVIVGNTDSIQREIFRLVVEHCKKNLMFDKSQLDLDVAQCSYFFHMYGEGADDENSIEFVSDKFPELRENASEKDKVEYHSSLMLKENCDLDEGVSRNFHIANLENQYDILSKLLIDKKAIPSKLYYTPQMKDWSAMRNNQDFLTDIVIVDPYLLSFYGKDLANSKKSLLSMIGALVGSEMKPIRMVIYCNYEIDTEKKYEYSLLDWDTDIKKKLPQTSSLTFVRPHFTSKDMKLHDRYIITNRQLFVSGHSFSKYYNRYDDFSAYGSCWLSINSLAYNENSSLVVQILTELEDYIVKYCSHASGAIVGDGKSNFLKIPKDKVHDIGEYLQNKSQYDNTRDVKKKCKR